MHTDGRGMAYTPLDSNFESGYISCVLDEISDRFAAYSGLYAFKQRKPGTIHFRGRYALLLTFM